MALLETYIAQSPPLRELENGAVRIEGTRVSLDSVIYHFNQGRTPEDIVRSFTTLKLSDIYAVISYYLENRDTVDAYINRRRTEAEEIRREIEAMHPPEDYNIILSGVLQRLPMLDIVRVQDVGLMKTHDSRVLAWAAQENRVVLTHDVNTLIAEAHQRVADGLPMPGVLASQQVMAVGPIIRDLVFIIENSSDDEWNNEVVFLPV